MVISIFQSNRMAFMMTKRLSCGGGEGLVVFRGVDFFSYLLFLGPLLAATDGTWLMDDWKRNSRNASSIVCLNVFVAVVDRSWLLLVPLFWIIFCFLFTYLSYIKDI